MASQDAIRILKDVVRSAPNVPDSYFTLGIIHESLGDMPRCGFCIGPFAMCIEAGGVCDEQWFQCAGRSTFTCSALQFNLRRSSTSDERLLSRSKLAASTTPSNCSSACVPSSIIPAISSLQEKGTKQYPDNGCAGFADRSIRRWGERATGVFARGDGEPAPSGQSVRGGASGWLKLQ